MRGALEEATGICVSWPPQRRSGSASERSKCAFFLQQHMNNYFLLVCEIDWLYVSEGIDQYVSGSD